MLTLDIRPWCAARPLNVRGCFLPPAIFGMMLDEEFDSEDEFVDLAMAKIDPTPKNLYVPFNPPVFPFDNKDFEDPFYLVENSQGDMIDLEYLKDLSDEELGSYFRDIFVRFSYKSDGRIKIKKKELLHYVGKNYYFEMKKATTGNAHKADVRKKKSFLTERARSLSSMHIPETTRRGIMRRNVFSDNVIISEDDIVNFKRHSKERADILVAIDTSESMGQGGKLQYAKKACLSFHYFHNNRESKVEFVSFNDKIEKVDPLDVLTLKHVGMTHTAELLDFAFHYFSRIGGANRQLYIITDGYPQQAGVEDAQYLSVTLKTAMRLRQQHIQTKILLVHAPGYDINPNNMKFNAMIADRLGGQLIRVDADGLSNALVDVDMRAVSN